MIFSSLNYLLFLPIVFLLYWVTSGKVRKVVLLVASYVFYMSWLPAYGILLFVLTAANYGLGLLLEKDRKSGFLLCLALLLNLGALAYYKYANFIVTSVFQATETISQLAGLTFVVPTSPALQILLPLGISFFVFEFVHYLVDIRRGSSAIRNPVDFAVFAAFFPSQIAGPIKRFQEFAPQLKEDKVLRKDDVVEGLAYLTKGLFKKVALADNLALISQFAAAPNPGLGTVDAWVVMFAFILQIYFDFSGYTDMGIGSARLLGFHLPNNFNLPLFASKNMLDFWQRWHITLSTWLADYIQTPLAGRRPSRTKFNICTMVTFLACGLWHGADWHFVAWGAVNGAALVVTRTYVKAIKSVAALKWLHDQPWSYPAACLGTFLTLCVLQSFFIASSVANAISIVRSMFVYTDSTFKSLTVFAESPCLVPLVLYAIYGLLLVEIPWMPVRQPSRVKEFLTATTSRRVALCTCAMIAAIAFSPVNSSPFIYFQF